MTGLVQIRYVPDDVRRTLKARAAAQGESFNEYLLQLIIADAARPSVAEVLARAQQRSERASASSADLIRAERDTRG